MNTANLQLEGLLVGISALLQSLRQKGLLTEDEIDATLEAAEQAVKADQERPEELSPANVDAVLFPIRYLRAANARGENEAISPFSIMASKVGQSKRDPAQRL